MLSVILLETKTYFCISAFSEFNVAMSLSIFASKSLATCAKVAICLSVTSTLGSSVTGGYCPCSHPLLLIALKQENIYSSTGKSASQLI
jgi:hypothetical protein